MVKAWKEDIVIPTYECGEYEKTPIFLENRVYQGSSGVVYPYPVVEKIADEKTDHTYHAVWIENEYIKVMILPELGGRVQMAYDKVRERHFVYYNSVIKPALVGLAGPWISGGIEFNWPQHHRPSTFLPVDSTIEEHEDGSVTIWLNEQERMFHQKALCGFTLRPGCAYLEIEGHLYNRTPLPQTFLWWANPAVHVNDAYRSIFPPDINAVFDHGKRAVSTFPIATGTYYKMDYSAGVNIANYKNIKVPTSYMAVNSKYNFEGGYENDTKGGMLHVASNHFSPGKKQWTWGNGDFGRAWDRNLTDTDGPYIELMAGIYTENQPDFTWLMPYEEKTFKQYFMPYHDLPDVKNASKDLVMNVEPVDDGHLRVQVYGTSERDVLLSCGEYEERIHVSPVQIFDTVIPAETRDAQVQLLDVAPNPRNGSVLLDYAPEPDEIRRTPDAAEAALPPEQTLTVEQLYLTGLHLEQYRHASWSPVDYYEEALRRDPNDVRCNKQLGLWYLRRGVYEKALPYLKRAVKMLQKRNPNPYDGEPLYYMALCYELMDETREAYKWFWKASWNSGWAAASFLHCAVISLNEGRYEDALDEVNRSLSFGVFNHKAVAVKAVVLRFLGEAEAMNQVIKKELSRDAFNFPCLYLSALEQGDVSMDALRQLLHQSDCNYDDLALDLVEVGLQEDAVAVWKMAVQEGCASAMSLFHLSRYAHGDEVEEYYIQAETGSMGAFFPNRLEDIATLLHHVRVHDSARAAYLLGNLYYDKRQYDLALTFWQFSAEHNPQFPTVWRNLALYYYNKEKQGDVSIARARECMERAFYLDESDARIFMELDQLYKKLGHSAADRFALYESHPQAVALRDDLVLERATLLNDLGRYAEAKDILDQHIFHPWEGGEGKVSTQYQRCRIAMASVLMGMPALPGTGDVSTKAVSHTSLSTKENLITAVSLLRECLSFPDNLGEGKLYGAQDNDIYYCLGNAYSLLAACDVTPSEREAYAAESHACYEQGTQGPTEPAAALYYNDAKPEKIYFAGLCHHALGNDAAARSLFYRLVNYGKQHYYDEVKMDYFAVSLPDLLVWDEDLTIRNRTHCLSMIELGTKGLACVCE